MGLFNILFVDALHVFLMCELETVVIHWPAGLSTGVLIEFDCYEPSGIIGTILIFFLQKHSVGVSTSFALCCYKIKRTSTASPFRNTLIYLLWSTQHKLIKYN